MAEGATRKKPRSMWPATLGCALVGAATVAVLLVPLPPVPREWTVRGLLALLAVGAVAWMIASGPVEPTESNRAERITFQTVFFWAFVTGVSFVLRPDSMAMGPVTTVLIGAGGAVIFGALMWVHDAWFSPPRTP